MITYGSPDFDKFARYVLNWEGGLSNHPADYAARFVARGQYHTNRGIIWPTFQFYAKSIGVAATYENFLKLTKEQCKQILWQFLLSVKGNRYKSPQIALSVTEFAWGSGGGNAIKHLQTALLNLGQNIRRTGIFDQQTIDAANRVNQAALYAELWKVREAFLRAIVRNNPSQGVFLQGWLNRVRDFQKRFPYSAAATGLGLAAIAAFFFWWRSRKNP